MGRGYQARTRWGAGALVVGAFLSPAVASADGGEDEDDAAEVEGETVELVGDPPDLGAPPSYELEADVVQIMPGTGGDTLKALQSLPGAARIPFGFGGLALRGTNPRDTRVYLDDIEVPILYHFGGLASFYPSSLVRSLDMVPGGFGAAYGRGQGGLVTVKPRDARRDRVRAGGHISLLDASAQLEAPTPGGGGLIAGLRRSYIDGLLALAMPADERVLPRYFDGQARWTRGDAGSGEWTAKLFFSEDVITAREDGASLSFRLGFVRGAARYRKRVGDVTTSALAWIGADRLRLRDTPAADFDDGFEARRVVAPAGARAEIVRDFERGHLAAGLDTQWARYGAVVIDDADADAQSLRGARWAGDVGLWTEARVRLDDGLFGVTPGLRLDRFGLTGEWLFAPRLTITHELTPRLTLREIVGLYHQPPGDLDLFEEDEQELRSARAAHVAAAAEVRLPASIDAHVTGYTLLGDRQPVAVAPPADWGSDAPSRSTGGLGPVFQLLLEDQLGSGQYRESRGHLRSYGVEVGATHRRGPWLGMLSYTLSRAERTDDPERFVGWRLYELDQTHNLVAMLSRRFDRWRFGARLRVATGNPYTPIADLAIDGRPVYGDPLSARMPPHIQLDVRADYHWEPRWGSGTMKAFLDVQNATHRRNAEGVTHEGTEPQFTRGLPILPIVGLEYRPPP